MRQQAASLQAYGTRHQVDGISKMNTGSTVASLPVSLSSWEWPADVHAVGTHQIAAGNEQGDGMASSANERDQQARAASCRNSRCCRLRSGPALHPMAVACPPALQFSGSAFKVASVHAEMRIGAILAPMNLEGR